MEQERAKLERMIMNNEEYEDILKQSQILDKYINKKLRIKLRTIIK